MPRDIIRMVPRIPVGPPPCRRCEERINLALATLGLLIATNVIWVVIIYLLSRGGSGK